MSHSPSPDKKKRLETEVDPMPEHYGVRLRSNEDNKEDSEVLPGAGSESAPSGYGAVLELLEGKGAVALLAQNEEPEKPVKPTFVSESRKLVHGTYDEPAIASKSDVQNQSREYSYQKTSKYFNQDAAEHSFQGKNQKQEDLDELEKSLLENADLSNSKHDDPLLSAPSKQKHKWKDVSLSFADDVKDPEQIMPQNNLPHEDSEEEKMDEVGETFHKEALYGGYQDAVFDSDYAKPAAAHALAEALNPSPNESHDVLHRKYESKALYGGYQDAVFDSDYAKPAAAHALAEALNPPPNESHDVLHRKYESKVEDPNYPKPAAKEALANALVWNEPDDFVYKNVDVNNREAQLIDPANDNAIPAASSTAVKKALAGALVSDEPGVGGSVIDDENAANENTLDGLDEMQRKIAELRARHQAKKKHSSPEKTLPVESPPVEVSTEKTIKERMKKFIKESPERPPKVLKEKAPPPRQDPQEVLDELAEKIRGFKQQMTKKKSVPVESTRVERLTNELVEEITQINSGVTKPAAVRSKRKRSLKSESSTVGPSRSRTRKRVTYYRPEYKKEIPPTFDKNSVRSQIRKRFNSIKEEVMAEQNKEEATSSHQKHLLDTLTSNLKSKSNPTQNPLIPGVNLHVKTLEDDPPPRRTPVKVYFSSSRSQVEDLLKPTEPTLPPNFRKSKRRPRVPSISSSRKDKDRGRILDFILPSRR